MKFESDADWSDPVFEILELEVVDVDVVDVDVVDVDVVEIVESVGSSSSSSVS